MKQLNKFKIIIDDQEQDSGDLLLVNDQIAHEVYDQYAGICGESEYRQWVIVNCQLPKLGFLTNSGIY